MRLANANQSVARHTMAEGGGICDYWTIGNRVTDPQLMKMEVL